VQKQSTRSQQVPDSIIPYTGVDWRVKGCNEGIMK